MANSPTPDNSPAKQQHFDDERKYSSLRVAFYGACSLALGLFFNLVNAYMPNLISFEVVTFSSPFAIIAGEFLYTRMLNKQARSGRVEFRKEKAERMLLLLEEESRVLNLINDKDADPDVRKINLKSYERIQEFKLQYLDEDEGLPDGTGWKPLGKE